MSVLSLITMAAGGIMGLLAIYRAECGIGSARSLWLLFSGAIAGMSAGGLMLALQAN